MTTQRGRAASPIRPGLITKQVLLGEIPLETGEHATEVAITDIHSAYKGVLNRHNQLRPRAKRLKGMTLSSFYTMFKFAQLLRLVELVRTEPMKFPPPKGSLYTVEKIGEEVRAIVSMRKIFRLTGIGRDDEKSWLDLTRAWKEGWSAPQKVEFVPPTEVPIPEEKLELRRRVPEVAPDAAIPKFKWVVSPSQRQYGLLLNHLLVLEQLNQFRPDVIKHIDDLATRIGDWVIAIEDSLEDARTAENVHLIDRLTLEKSLLDQTFEGLMDRDLEKATTALRKLIGP